MKLQKAKQHARAYHALEYAEPTPTPTPKPADPSKLPHVDKDKGKTVAQSALKSLSAGCQKALATQISKITGALNTSNAGGLTIFDGRDPAVAAAPFSAFIDGGSSQSAVNQMCTPGVPAFVPSKSAPGGGIVTSPYVILCPTFASYPQAIQTQTLTSKWRPLRTQPVYPTRVTRP
jgi:hypothetical protein